MNIKILLATLALAQAHGSYGAPTNFVTENGNSDGTQFMVNHPTQDGFLPNFGENVRLVLVRNGKVPPPPPPRKAVRQSRPPIPVVRNPEFLDRLQLASNRDRSPRIINRDTSHLKRITQEQLNLSSDMLIEFDDLAGLKDFARTTMMSRSNMRDIFVKICSKGKLDMAKFWANHFWFAFSTVNVREVAFQSLQGAVRTDSYWMIDYLQQAFGFDMMYLPDEIDALVQMAISNDAVNSLIKLLEMFPATQQQIDEYANLFADRQQYLASHSMGSGTPVSSETRLSSQ